MKVKTMDLVKTPKFQLGKIVATPAALEVLQKANVRPASLLHRHQSGEDWGNICEEDKQQNNIAISNEGNPDKQQRVLSSYKIGKDTIWIITEHDRSVSTLLCPSDY